MASPDVQIVLYDLKGRLPESPAPTYSPFVWRIRTILAYKGLKFRTEWLEYTEIEQLSKSIGAQPSGTRFDKPLYTCPIIQDLQNGGKAVSDSLLIAEYLDEAYPNTPRVIPEGTRALFAAFGDGITNNLHSGAFGFVAPKLWQNLNPASQPYWRETRERTWASKLEDMAPPETDQEKRIEVWKKKVTPGLEKISGWYKSENDIYVMGGDRISFADFQLFGHFLFLGRFLGEESEEWKAICEGQGGRWKRLMDSLEKYKC